LEPVKTLIADPVFVQAKLRFEGDRKAAQTEKGRPQKTTSEAVLYSHLRTEAECLARSSRWLLGCNIWVDGRSAVALWKSLAVQERQGFQKS